MRKHWLALFVVAVVVVAALAYIVAPKPKFHPHYKNYDVELGPAHAQGS